MARTQAVLSFPSTRRYDRCTYRNYSAPRWSPDHANYSRLSAADTGQQTTPRRTASGWWRRRSRTCVSSPGLRQPREVDDLVVARPAAQPLGIGARGAFDEHLQRAPHEPLGALVRVALDRLHEPSHPLHLHGVGHDSLASCSPASVPRRGENTNVNAPSYPTFSTTSSVCAKSSSVSPGKPDDDVGAERRVGNVLADQRDPVQVALAVVRAPHRLQDPARTRLQRQMDVLAHALKLRVRADHVLAHVLRVRARVADALDPLDRVDLSEQLRERRTLAGAGRARRS